MHLPSSRWYPCIAALAWAVAASCATGSDEASSAGGTAGAPGSGGHGGVGGTQLVAGGGTGGAGGFADCAEAEAARGSTGCDFWSLMTDIIPEGDGACFAAFVTNAGAEPLHITVELDGVSLPVGQFTRVPNGQGPNIVYGAYDSAAGLPGASVAIVFLAQNHDVASQMPNCPVLPAVITQAYVDGTGMGKAFHITTDRPAVAYQILPYGSGQAMATSATLLLPTSAWDTNYIAVNAYAKSAIVPEAAPSLDILAREDATTITLLPTVDIEAGGGVASGTAGQPWSLTLSAGEYVQITQAPELTGSPIQSDKPIAVWGGASCLNVPVGESACDSAQQQLPPVKALGSEYAGVRYRGRQGEDEAPPWRLVGAVNGTQLAWEPTTPGGAPAQLDLGQVAELETPGPFVVKSQDADHPFYLFAYMTGGGPFGGEGDPEWVQVIATGQYLDAYVLFTDPTYPETNLVVVRKPSGIGSFADVVLDCAGPLGGWQPLGAYEYTRVDLVTGDFEEVNGCANGRHEIASSLPFAVTVWGWGTAAAEYLGQPTHYVSYAYPAGMSVVPINDVVVPPR
jgi:IgGFc binding protein